MPRGILIPADDDLPLEVKNFVGLKDLQKAVQGFIEPIDIERPAATLFANEEGAIHNLQKNLRASLICWTHNSRYRGHSVLRGDVVLIGQPNTEGDTQDIPASLEELLLATPSYAVQVSTINESTEWHGNQARYDSWVTAYIAGISLAERWSLVDNVRIIAA